MLDFSTHIRSEEGIVVFKRPASHYVPRESGIYRICVIPYSYSQGFSSSIEKYLATFDELKFDARDKVDAKFVKEDRATYLRIWKKIPNLSSRPQISKSVLRLATFFPPFYVGQATVLRNRFLEHERGFNSHIRNDLEKYGLDKHVAFFHWHLCDRNELDHLESVLIQAHRPILNRQLR